VLFGELLIHLEESGLTNTYREIEQFCEHYNIGYLVLRYLSAGQPPFEKWAEEWPHDGKI
jgi:hypothetical protein